MPKRTPETEEPEAEPVPEVPPTVGERLRAAREKRSLSLEDVAAQTRIPQRHLASIESAEWDSLPAPTYTIGFAKNYAAVVGLDRSEIGDQLREEMGGQRFATTSADVFEPADPRAHHAEIAGDRRGDRRRAADRADELPQSPLARSAGPECGDRWPTSGASARASPAPRRRHPPRRRAGGADRDWRRPGSRSPTRARPCSRASCSQGRPIRSRRRPPRRC